MVKIWTIVGCLVFLDHGVQYKLQNATKINLLLINKPIGVGKSLGCKFEKKLESCCLQCIITSCVKNVIFIRH